ncbi:MAG TPA: MarR family transcriptional regulator [Acidimicrobiales bacterium]|nr:MarR family transcriptional regulator [Acidimicrobiales bacterium]
MPTDSRSSHPRSPRAHDDAPAPVSSWREELGLPGDADFLTRIIRLNLLVSRGLESVVEPFGIGVGDYLVLSTVRRSPGGRNAPTQLCRVLGRTTGGMTLTLDRLESNGLVKRLPDPDDRRRVIVALSSEGRRLATRVNTALHRWEASLAPAAPRQHDLRDALDRLLQLFEPGP